MQDTVKRKQIILNALAKTLKECRGNKSRFMFASENDISTSIISTIERAIKDPQLTTVFKIAEACNMDIVEFISKIKKYLPEDFSLIDK